MWNWSAQRKKYGHQSGLKKDVIMLKEESGLQGRWSPYCYCGSNRW
jgi:hypothetical protein